MRREALDFFASLVNKLEQPNKDRVLDRIDLIRQLLYIITHESNTALICKNLKLIESCFYHGSMSDLEDEMAAHEDCESPVSDPRWLSSMNVSQLFRFF